MSGRDVLTVKEVAARLECGVATVYREVERGNFQGYRVGKSIRIYVDSVDQYLSQRHFEPNHEA
ncbi:helix-turn-helix domain-containing protein [Desulfovibrio inopinatus]|uniref:helix-turn-helix domain-containing protein n=1 Tax=Desulfovibrio inopinatus TaxID=102109 RepID=UPI00040D88BB|nr:helix-turn-helix domain-containing protein [Desulfovibrio inopinatus]